MEGVSAFFRDLSRPVEIYLHPSLDHELARKAAIDIEVRNIKLRRGQSSRIIGAHPLNSLLAVLGLL